MAVIFSNKQEEAFLAFIKSLEECDKNGDNPFMPISKAWLEGYNWALKEAIIKLRGEELHKAAESIEQLRGK